MSVRETLPLSEALTEVTNGVGPEWQRYRLVGAARAGLAPAKERVGKHPERYKLVEPGTIFYNPMRILIGSIALIDDGDEPGITSPDYVVLRTRPGKLHHRWFYYWLRSPAGAAFIKTLARGAVRERMLFRRLVAGRICAPDWTDQLAFAAMVERVRMTRHAIQQQLAALDALPNALRRMLYFVVRSRVHATDPRSREASPGTPSAERHNER